MLGDALVVGVSAAGVAFALVTGHAHGPAGWARRRVRRAALRAGAFLVGRGREWRRAARQALDCVMCAATWAGVAAGVVGWGVGGLSAFAGACVPGVAVVVGVVVRRFVRGG